MLFRSAAATPSSSRCPPSNPFPDPKPLHLSVRLFSPLPKLPLLSCSGPHVPCAATGDGSGAGNHGNDSGGNGGKYGGGNDDDDGGGEDYEEAEFGPLLGFNEVLRLAAARGVALPADMLEAAKDAGIREVLLLRYFDLQVYRIAQIFTEGINPAVSSPLSICAGRTVATQRDDPGLLSASQQNARRSFIPL